MAAFENAARVWDERFGGSDYVFGTAPNAWLAGKRHRLRPGQRAQAGLSALIGMVARRPHDLSR